MIEIFIFYLHIVAFLYAFTKNWMYRSIKEGFLGIAILFLIFAIGWALTGTLAYAIYPENWHSLYFSHNTLALVMLTIPESFFFYYFFVKDTAENETNA